LTPIAGLCAGVTRWPWGLVDALASAGALVLCVAFARALGAIIDGITS
jgi:hypothetical protein